MTPFSMTLDQVKALHLAGQLKEAKQGYFSLLQSNPNQSDILHGLGLLFAEEGNLDEAEIYLKKAIYIESHDVYLYLHYANILKAKGKIDEAASILQEVICSHPHFAAAYNNLGVLYAMQEHWQQALLAYQTAIDKQSNYVDAYYNQGLVLVKLNRFDEAFHTIDAVLSLSHQHVGAHFQCGLLLMREEKYKDALDHFNLIHQYHPYHVETIINSAICYLKCSKMKEAKEYYLKALAITPRDTQILFNLGVISTKQNSIKNAIAYYQEALAIHPEYLEAHHNIGMLYVMINHKQYALDHFHQILQLNPNDRIAKHMINIIEKNQVSESPHEYIRYLFDSYADHFDAHLENLNYQLPKWMYHTLIRYTDEQYQTWHILDLGCGTGLCGSQFKTTSNKLVGVDLSEKMIEVAASKTCYDALFVDDVLTFLEKNQTQYDLIIAGDLMVYFGDLSVLFTLIYRTLKLNGYFIFNTEILGSEETQSKNEKESYYLTSSGRFTHHQAYLEKLGLDNQFNVIFHDELDMRTQNHQFVRGHLVLLKKV